MSSTNQIKKVTPTKKYEEPPNRRFISRFSNIHAWQSKEKSTAPFTAPSKIKTA